MNTIIKQFFQRESHVSIQFVKYGISGGIATLVDLFVFYFLSWFVFQSLTCGDIFFSLFQLDPPIIEETIRSRNFVINSVTAFLFSNLMAYLMNFYWVFHPGRHRRYVEIILFYLISIISLGVGTFFGWAMIRFIGLTTTSSYFGKIAASLTINFICRKYIVFRR